MARTERKTLAAELHGQFTRGETRFIDRVMMLVAVIHPLTAVPQAVEIYRNQSAANVSLATWLCFMLIGLVFFLYSVAHHLTPMIVNQILWFAVDISIVTGIILYG